MNDVTDISGFRVFNRGEVGSAHVFAHRMLDAGQPAEGSARLGRWLESHHGEGSTWVHVQWHQMVFDLALGSWDAAYRRFMEHVLPHAGSDAMTDAPSGIWRLWLAAPGPVNLPWAQVGESVSATRLRHRDPYVVLHALLALAGAGDLASLEAGLDASAEERRTPPALLAMGRALHGYAAGDYAGALAAFDQGLPGLSELGGSRAQNELFVDLYRLTFSRATAQGPRVASAMGRVSEAQGAATLAA